MFDNKRWYMSMIKEFNNKLLKPNLSRNYLFTNHEQFPATKYNK